MKNAFTWLRITFCSFAALLTLASCQNAADELYKPSVQKYPVSFMVGLFGIEDGGKITAKVDGKEIKSGSSVERGKIVEFTAHPDYGKTAGLWDIQGGTFEAGSGNPRSDTARVKVNNYIFVSIYFTAASSYSHIVSFGIEGNTGASRLTARYAGGTAIVSGNEVSDGSVVEFTARPENGKTVDRWFIEGGSFEAGSGIAGSDTARVKVSNNIRVRVSFKDADPNKRIVTFGIEGNAGENGITAAVAGGTTIVSGNEVSDGAFVEFTAVPAPGYKVKSWTIVKTEDKSPLTFEEGGTEGSLRAKAKAACNLTVKVEFERIVYTVVFTVPEEHGTLTAQKNWQNFETGGNAFYGDELTFTAAAEEGYKLKSWTIVNTDDNSSVPFETGTYNGKPYVSMKVTCNLTVKAEFEKCEYTITFTVEGEHGSVTAKKKGSDFTSGSKAFYGDELLFTAVPDTDYKVREWTVNGQSVGTDTAYRLTVTNDITVSVKFKGALFITLHGDDRVDETASGYINIAKGETWAQVKTQMEAALILKGVWQGGDYGAYQWKLNDKDGSLLDDNYTFTDDTAIYAVTNYLKFKTNGTVLTGYNGERPRGRIILSGTITDIYGSAFRDCTGITAVDFSACTNLMTINWRAFSGCAGITEEIKLPPGLTKIGSFAFSDCTGITTVDFSACTNLMIIDESAFSGCTGITGEVKLPSGLIEIGSSVFSGCTGVTGLDFSACTRFTKIIVGAFSNLTGLKKIILPASLTKIEGYNNAGAFYGCTGLETVDFSACTNLVEIYGDAFANCTSLTNLDFSACTSLEYVSGFKGCTGIRKIKLSPALYKIFDDAFIGCTNLTSIDFSACTKLTKIDNRFGDFTNLKELILPASLKEINGNVFSNCNNLKIVDFSRCTKLITISGFNDCKGLTNIDLSACGELKELNGFRDCENLESFNLLGCTKLLYITNRLFYGRKNLKNIDLSSCTELSSIGSEAFFGCKNLKNIDLSSCTKLMYIGGGAFSGCENLTNVNFPAGTNFTDIYDRAFYECTSLTNVDLSSCTGLTRIAFEAFDGCIQAEIKLPESITSISGDAFGPRLFLTRWCKKVKIKGGKNFNRIKAIVVASGYPEDRIEQY